MWPEGAAVAQHRPAVSGPTQGGVPRHRGPGLVDESDDPDRQVPQAFLADSGLTAHVLGVAAPRLAEQPQLAGPLLESFVATEVRRQIGWSRTRPRIAHFRTRSGAEVDLVLEARDGQVVGVEVKASSTVRSEDFAGLRALADVAGPRLRRGVVLYTGSEQVSFGPGLIALPLAALWTMPARGSRQT